MLSFSRIRPLAVSLNTIVSSFAHLNISSCCSPLVNSRPSVAQLTGVSINHLHTSSIRNDLMEFFDDKKNWGETTVKVGRAWRKEELRIKSNSDLHKLWFVLLKERNMLLTMEHDAKENVRLFPNPERIDKVDESMENLEAVVRERNRAYFELETGESGERPGMLKTSELGYRSYYRMAEYPIPKFMNRKWFKKYCNPYSTIGVQRFQQLYREKCSIEKRRALRREMNHVRGLLKRFPHMDIEALKKAHPNVDVGKVMQDRKTLGHHEHNRA